jgi:hypothetical protein
MKHTRRTRLGKAWLCLTATAFLSMGCTPPGAAWNGIFAVDVAGAAKTCVAPTASPPDGQGIVAQIQVSNEGGWCGMTVTRGGVPYESYLLVTHPSHGKVFAHRVGTSTRVDYTPDTGFTGTDSFAIKLIPGNAMVQGAVTVTPAPR